MPPPTSVKRVYIYKIQVDDFQTEVGRREPGGKGDDESTTLKWPEKSFGGACARSRGRGGNYMAAALAEANELIRAAHQMREPRPPREGRRAEGGGAKRSYGYARARATREGGLGAAEKLIEVNCIAL